jgi:hypothetical protein
MGRAPRGSLSALRARKTRIQDRCKTRVDSKGLAGSDVARVKTTWRDYHIRNPNGGARNIYVRYRRVCVLPRLEAVADEVRSVIRIAQSNIENTGQKRGLARRIRVAARRPRRHCRRSDHFADENRRRSGSVVRLRQKGRAGDVSDTCEALVHVDVSRIIQRSSQTHATSRAKLAWGLARRPLW